MQINGWHRFLWRFKPLQLWRFLILNIRILRGVSYDKRLPRFEIRYKVDYHVLDGGHPSAIANLRRPPGAGDIVELAYAKVKVVEVTQVTRPRGEFCFLRADCRVVEGREDSGE